MIGINNWDYCCGRNCPALMVSGLKKKKKEEGKSKDGNKNVDQNDQIDANANFIRPHGKFSDEL